MSRRARVNRGFRRRSRAVPGLLLLLGRSRCGCLQVIDPTVQPLNQPFDAAQPIAQTPHRRRRAPGLLFGEFLANARRPLLPACPARVGRALVVEDAPDLAPAALPAALGALADESALGRSGPSLRGGGPALVGVAAAALVRSHFVACDRLEPGRFNGPR